MSSTTYSTTASWTHLPREIVDLCFDLIANDRATLRKALFISPAFLPACRRRLFATVEIDMISWASKYTVDEMVDELNAFWGTSTHLLEYINTLVVKTKWDHREGRERILALFSECQLKEFRFNLPLECSGHDDGWEDVSTFLMARSTTSLVTLDLVNIAHIPYGLLLSLPNLNTLRFCPTHSKPVEEGNRSPYEQDPSQFNIQANFELHELEVSDCVDNLMWSSLSRFLKFSSIRRLSVIHRSPYVSPQLEAFLDRAAPHVEELVWRPSHLLLAADRDTQYPLLRLQRYTNLRSLELRGPHMNEWQCDRNIASWVRRSIRSLPNNIVLQTLVLDFPFRDLYRIPASWRTYDSSYCPHPHSSNGCRPALIDRTSGRAERQFKLLDRALSRQENIKRVRVMTHVEGEVKAFSRLKFQGKLELVHKEVCWGEIWSAFWESG